ncbi:hypothetical protein NIES3974_31030 [Calothrix sp. NIES-3974]|nr:hypothetical protein NIES3974_31030 [Calothrix sp. NIES-3974]
MALFVYTNISEELIRFFLYILYLMYLIVEQPHKSVFNRTSSLVLDCILCNK